MATKALVNNKTFQRFALKTVQNSQKVAKAVGEKTSQVKNSSVRCLAFSLSPLRAGGMLTAAARAQTTQAKVTETKAGLRGMVDWVKDDLSKIGNKK